MNLFPSFVECFPNGLGPLMSTEHSMLRPPVQFMIGEFPPAPADSPSTISSDPVPDNAVSERIITITTFPGIHRVVELFKTVYTRFKGQPYRFDFDGPSNCVIAWLGDVYIGTFTSPKSLWDFIRREKRKPGSQLIKIVRKVKPSRVEEQRSIQDFLRLFGVKKVAPARIVAQPKATPEPKSARTLTFEDLFPSKTN